MHHLSVKEQLGTLCFLSDAIPPLEKGLALSILGEEEASGVQKAKQEI